MNCAIYARVSTSDHGQNPETQLLPLRAYAEARGWTAKEYVDTGVSGTKESRPALDRLMAAARRREIGAVLVFRFDRFARSTKHLVMALEEFNSLGVQFISHQEAIDTSTPMGKAMFAIIGAMAELERNLIVERVKAGLARAKAEGKHIGGQRRVFNRQRALELHAEGRTLRDIAAELNVAKSTIDRVLKAVV